MNSKIFPSYCCFVVFTHHDNENIFFYKYYGKTLLYIPTLFLNLKITIRLLFTFQIDKFDFCLHSEKINAYTPLIDQANH